MRRDEPVPRNEDLRDVIPGLPVPLRRPDPAVWIDLGAVYNDAFTRGAYPRRLRYATPIARLAPDDAAWAAERAREAKAR